MPGRAALASFVILATILVMTSMGWVYGILAALVLLRVGSEVLFPTRYEVNAEGVSITNPLRILRKPWSQYRHWRPHGQGILLRGRSSIPWLAERRSIVLAAPDPAALRETVSQWLEQDARENP